MHFPTQLKSILPLIVIFIIFYFLLIRPQQKAKKDHAKFLQNLKKNDKVVTSGGFIGEVTSVEGQYVHVTLDGTNTIKILKESIIKQFKDEETEKNK